MRNDTRKAVPTEVVLGLSRDGRSEGIIRFYQVVLGIDVNQYNEGNRMIWETPIDKAVGVVDVE